MKLSVIIPFYNKSSYLIEMLKTIMIQTFTDWELLLIDDGSEDCEYKRIEKFVADDTRIKLLKRDRNPKNGDTCRNIGMDKAQGEYVIIFDADDLISKTCFEYRVDFMDKHPEFDYVSFPSATFVDGTNDFRKREFDTTGVNTLERILSANYPFTVWANIYRRSVLNSIRWDENVYLYQDFDFMLQCEIRDLKHGWADITEPDYFYRIFTDGESVCTNVVSEKKQKSTNYLFAKTVNLLSKQQDGERYVSLFLRFVVLYYERLLRDNNNVYIEEFLSLIEKIYPCESDKFRSVYEKRISSRNKHYSLFLMYKSLYLFYKIPVHKTYALHEFLKTVLLKK